VKPHQPLAARPFTALNRAVAWSFHSGARKRERLPIPVISVGNLTSGGTGKTPLTQRLAEWLVQQGRRPAIALRGYGGTISPGNAVVSDGKHTLLTAEEAGDEALVHAGRLPGVPVLIGRDRVASGRQAIAQFDCDVLLLDDGFQYWRLQRDADLVLIEAQWLLGERHRRHFPRERLDALQRAQLVVLTRTELLDADQRHQAHALLARHTTPAACICECTFESEGLRDIAGQPLHWNGNCRLVAFSALANNESFFVAARGQRVGIAATLGFGDHHRYSAHDLVQLNRLAAEAGATGFLTTEKDGVKLDTTALQRPLAVLPIRARLRPEAEFFARLRELITH